MSLKDDDAVDLDCGCVAYAGDTYNQYSLNYVNQSGQKTISFTCCYSEDCFKDTMFEMLKDCFKHKEYRVLTSYDKKIIKADMEREDF